MNLLTFENVTLIIALWGAVLSTVMAVFQLSKKRWKLKVEIGYASYNSILISATNIGYEDVTFSLVGFILPNNKLLWNPLDVQKYQLPYTLPVGKSITIPQGNPKKLAVDLIDNGYSGKIKVRGFYKTDTGIIFKSKPVNFDTLEALGRGE